MKDANELPTSNSQPPRRSLLRHTLLRRQSAWALGVGNWEFPTRRHMQLGFVGLGRMGGNMTRRLVAGGHEVVAWDRNADAVQALARVGASGAASPADLGSRLTPPRAAWIMVPAARPAAQTATPPAEHPQPAGPP